MAVVLVVGVEFTGKSEFANALGDATGFIVDDEGVPRGLKIPYSGNSSVGIRKDFDALFEANIKKYSSVSPDSILTKGHLLTMARHLALDNVFGNSENYKHIVETYSNAMDGATMGIKPAAYVVLTVNQAQYMERLRAHHSELARNDALKEVRYSMNIPMLTQEYMKQYAMREAQANSARFITIETSPMHYSDKQLLRKELLSHDGVERLVYMMNASKSRM